MSELKAVIWLLEQGYDVFRNVSPCGHADLIAVNHETKEIIMVDVKTIMKRKRTMGFVTWAAPPSAQNENVRILCYSPEDNECYWAEQINKEREETDIRVGEAFTPSVFAKDKAIKRCERCGEGLESPRLRYCSAACRQAAYRAQPQ